RPHRGERLDRTCTNLQNVVGVRAGIPDAPFSVIKAVVDSRESDGRTGTGRTGAACLDAVGSVLQPNAEVVQVEIRLIRRDRFLLVAFHESVAHRPEDAVE